MLKYLIPLTALVLTGCNTVVQDFQFEQQKPMSASSRQDIAAYVKSQVKDPYSIRDARIAHGVPNGYRSGKNSHFVCVSFNAKNSYGAYAGVQAHSVGTENGRATDIWWRAPHCNNQPRLKWQPFPELNGR